jgi:hypothetical protein
MIGPSLTKFFLRVFIVSTCATALTGIFALTVPGEIDWLEIKILLTTLVIAGASICGLACGGCLTRGHTILPTAGLVLTGVAGVLLIIGLWTEVDSEIYWKFSAGLSFFAVACALLSMLFLANLAGSYRWAFLVAYQVVLGLATLLAAAVFYEDLFDNESYVRFTGVVSILVAAVTLLIPVFHYLSRDMFAEAQAQADPLFVVEEEIARVKKRLIELENKRRTLLGREPIETAIGAGDGTRR